MPDTLSAATAYAQRLSTLRAEASALEAESGRYSLFRAVTFLGALACGAYALFGEPPLAVAIVGGALFVAFIGLVVAHAMLVTKMGALDKRVGLIVRCEKRLAGDFAGFEEQGEGFADGSHAYAGDLDLFGKSSLFQLLSSAQTGEGEATLAAWLCEPASVSEIAARQAAVRELTPLTALREELAFEALRAGVRGRKAEPLAAWAEAKDGPSVADKKGLVLAAKVLVPLTVVLLALPQIVGAERLGLFVHAWVVALLLQGVVLGLLRPLVEPALAVASSREAPFGRYLPLLRRIEEQEVTSKRLSELRDRLRGEGGAARASEEMRALQGVLGYADLRHSGVVHFVANLLFLWDVWCGLALERWRHRAGPRVRGWLAVTGQIEALASLATFAYENPDYAFPEVVEGPPRFEAKGLGHPLLSRARRVVNDVSFGEPVPALVVTGSNMSGKSTLLRSVGVNAVLAHAGSVVCASSLTLTPLAVRTSMRMRDSLEEGVSHFYAEIKRLKMVVDSQRNGDRVLFLLDEILHGTNSRERLIGAKAVVRHLIDGGAIGAVSSHDLGLSSLEDETGGRVQNVHLEELVKDGQMSFDFVLKRGVVRTTNALRLMKIVGLGVELPDA